VEPSIFAKRSYTSGLLFSLVFVASMGGLVLVLNVLLQVGLHFSAWHSALTTAPFAAGAFVGSAIGGMTMGKLGRRVLHLGVAVESVGVLGIYAVLQIAGTGTGSLDLLAPMVVGGVGMAGVAPAEMGSAAAVLQSVNGLGTSVGIAGLGMVFLGVAGAGLPAQFVRAAEWTSLGVVALLGVAFVVAYLLPRHARVAGDVPAVEADAAAPMARPTPEPAAA